MTELDKLLEDLINAENCPQCDNSGRLPGGNEETGVEECKCQFCYIVPNGIFNRRFAIIQYVRKIKAEKSALKTAFAVARSNFHSWQARAVELESELETMKKYARHLSYCGAFKNERLIGDCTCGLDEALKEEN